MNPDIKITVKTDAEWIWVRARHRGKYIGHLDIYGPNTKRPGEILSVLVETGWRRQGVATAMLNAARPHSIVPIVHSDVRSIDGDAWARTTGDHLPIPELWQGVNA